MEIDINLIIKDQTSYSQNLGSASRGVYTCKQQIQILTDYKHKKDEY